MLHSFRLLLVCLTFHVIGAADLLIPPQIIKPPFPWNPATAGQSRTVYVQALGDALTYRWQRCDPLTGQWSAIAGATMNMYSIPPLQASQHGVKYRCVVANGLGEVASTPALFSVSNSRGLTPPLITWQSPPPTVIPPATAQFAVAVGYGSNPLSFRWQSAPVGGRFSDVPGATDPLLSVTVPDLAMNGRQYRCVVANSAGSAISAPTTLTVSANGPAISGPVLPTTATFPPVFVNTWPAFMSNSVGQLSILAADALAVPAPTFRWQLRRPGTTTWIDLPNETRKSLVGQPLTSADHGSAWRCIATNPLGSVTTVPMMIAVNDGGGYKPLVLTQPVGRTTSVDSTVQFIASAVGWPAAQHRWQLAAPGSNAFTDLPGATAQTLSLVASADRNGARVRCVFSNAKGSTISEPATLTIR
ncbi:hypothetical protein LBMAG53_29040 [Planctomycetota bacterium]|nr:hypothetical protein LBMAG53_29040 [Planctomycetota bacterium]